MFCLNKPTADEIKDLILDQSDLPFSYENAGATKSFEKPHGFSINHHSLKLGKGETAFTKATEAINQWQMYSLGWTKTEPEGLAIKEDVVFVTVINHLGFWSMNPCRIIYLINEETNGSKGSGFGFGTLPAHSEAGEEKFSVTWDKKTDEVFYEIFSFAKPQNPLAKIGFPYVSYLQKSFVRDSHKAMLNFVNEDSIV